MVERFSIRILLCLGGLEAGLTVACFVKNCRVDIFNWKIIKY